MKKLLSLIITFILFTALTSIAEPVIFNTSTKKVHKEHCASAKNVQRIALKLKEKTHITKEAFLVNNAEAKY